MAETLYIDGALVNGQINGYRIAFTMPDSSQLEYETSVSLDGDELRADTLYITLRCRESAVSVRPDALSGIPGLAVTGYVEFHTVREETFLTADGETFLVPDAEELAEVWLSMFRGVRGDTPVWYDNGNGRLEKYYWQSMKRVARYDFELTAQSALGRLTSKFKGGFYDGESLLDVLFEVLEGVPFTLDPRFDGLRVYGWIPYQTQRECLHLLALAYGFIIRREGGELFFTLPGTEAVPLSDNVIFNGGSVDYRIGQTYARADVTEYQFLKTDADREVILFDNTAGSAADRLTVIFSDAPVYGLACSGNLTIDTDGGKYDCNVNYAVVSGTGTLKGKLYTKITSVVSFEGDPDADPENVLPIDNIPLITSLNSGTVAAKYLAFSNAPAVVEMDFLRGTQSAGDLLSFADPYGAVRTGYLLSMSGKVTSLDRVSARLLCGYVHHWGNTYNCVIVKTGAGTWTVPEELDGKTVRVVLISGGNGGKSGQHGTDNVYIDGQSVEVSGSGAGSPGSGGKVYVTEISVSAGEVFAYQCGAGGAGGTPSGAYDTDENGRFTYRKIPGETGGATTFGAHSSDSGAASAFGYHDMIENGYYAVPGPDNGVDGGAAASGDEDGNRNDPQWTGVIYPAVTAYGQTWTAGGYGSGRYETHSGEDAYENWAYGGLGGGAAVGADGGNGTDARDSNWGGAGGHGADALPMFPESLWDTRQYGAGGSGGHGGGAGGQGGKGYATGSGQSAYNGSRGAGGSGSAGQAGKEGCVFIYYHI